MNYTIHFGGGLGDVINQIYKKGSYKFLETINDSDTVEIDIICSNPFAKEIFELHPRAKQFNIRQFPWWSPKDNGKNCIKYMIPVEQNFIKTNGDITFYNSKEDELILKEYNNISNKVVLALSAGLADRVIPQTVYSKLEELKNDYTLIQIGRTYERGHRQEPEVSFAQCNLINKLTVPGTLNLLKKSLGLVCSHSAMTIAGWHINLPELVLYPDSVKAHHFTTPDEWSFGKDFNTTTHCTYEDFTVDKLKQFKEVLNHERSNI